MKIQIDVMGFLRLFRISKFKYQECPFTTAQNYIAGKDREGVFHVQGDGAGKPCGDWCPHFGEPRSVTPIGPTEVPATYIEICHGRIRECLTADFSDERVR